MSELSKERLERDLSTLRKRAENLKRSIGELPDDADASDALFFNDELRFTEAKIGSMEKRLQKVLAEEEAARAKEEAEAEADLLRIYRDAEAAGRLHEMSPVLRERCLKAVEAEGNRRLFGPR